MKNEIFLVNPDVSYAEKIVEFRNEFLAAGSSMDGCLSLRKDEDPYVFLKNCEMFNNETTVPEGRVTATQLFLVRASDDKLLGMIQIRHRLNDYLKKFGGHIGYSIRPTERRKGYAKQMLKLTLPYCKRLGMEKVLITCIDGNIGSEKTIIANGGIYENTVFEPDKKIRLNRFWIAL